jgi:hypothetical protein
VFQHALECAFIFAHAGVLDPVIVQVSTGDPTTIQGGQVRPLRLVEICPKIPKVETVAGTRKGIDLL